MCDFKSIPVCTLPSYGRYGPIHCYYKFAVRFVIFVIFIIPFSNLSPLSCLGSSSIQSIAALCRVLLHRSLLTSIRTMSSGYLKWLRYRRSTFIPFLSHGSFSKAYSGAKVNGKYWITLTHNLSITSY